MKKRELKRCLEIATDTLRMYEDYMIDGRKYANEALLKLDRMNKTQEKLDYVTDELRKLTNSTISSDEINTKIRRVLFRLMDIK